MIADTWLLIGLRRQVAWNTFKNRKLAAQVFSVVGGVLIALMVAGGAALLGIGLGALLRRFPNPDLAALIPGALLTMVAFLLLLTSFGVALGSLFLTSDLDMLMSAPVDRRAVFISKLLDGMVPSYMILMVSALPALLAFGLGLGYGPLYYILVVVAVLGMPLLPAGLGALMVMVVARVAPARRVREVLGLMGALFGVACGVLGQTSRYWMDAFVPTDTANADAALENVRGLVNLPIPPMMAGRGLAAAGSGDYATALVAFGGFLVLTFGFFAVCVWIADTLYAAGWVRMQSSGSAKRSKQRAAKAAANSGLLGRAPAWFAIFLKDWRIIPRDLRNFAQMLAPLALLPFIMFNILSGGGRRNPFQGLSGFRNGVDPTGVFIAAGVLLTTLFIFGRVAETSISMESKSWWLVKAAPISPSELLLGKYLTAAIPFLVISTILMGAATLWRGFHPLWALYGWFSIELLGLGMLAVAVGIAVPWARLDWDDPRRMLSWQTAIVTLVAWVLLGVIGGGMILLPFFTEMFSPELVGPMMLLGALLAAAVMAAASYAAFRLGISRLPQVGEA
jgi:ABC-2 type transport system permease protein